MKQTLHIKNMVCRRCVMTVEMICRDMGLDATSVSMGEVVLPQSIGDEALGEFRRRLEEVGFSLIDESDVLIVEQAKSAIRTMARDEGAYKYKLSAYVEDRLGEDFAVVSRLFSEREGRSMQTYQMQQRIEYVKELLQDRQLTLAEIADRVGFSSVAHLSRAFKNVQGMTISEYRGAQNRLGLDEV